MGLAANWIQLDSPQLFKSGYPTRSYPGKSTPIKTIGNQFLQTNAVGNGVKHFTKVQVNRTVFVPITNNFQQFSMIFTITVEKQHEYMSLPGLIAMTKIVQVKRRELVIQGTLAPCNL